MTYVARANRIHQNRKRKVAKMTRLHKKRQTKARKYS